MGILHMADSAGVPTSKSLHRAKKAGIDAWAGYLPSPYASVSWSPEECVAALDAVGRFLPVFVAPYNAATLHNMNPARDAADALSGFEAVVKAAPHAKFVGKPTLCLDIEEPAWEASPADVLHYFAAFRGDLAKEGVEVAPYGSASTCIGLGQHSDIPAVFVAAWFYNAGRAPKSWPTAVEPQGLGSAWRGHRAWQFAGNVRRFGRLVDIGVADEAFPFLAHPAAPAAKPSHKPEAEVTVKVGGKSYSGTIHEA